jgi:replicative DNA helicase
MEPASLDAERSLLGIIISRNETLYEVSQTLLKADFFDNANGEIYDLLRDLIEGGRQVTASTLVHDAQDAVIWGELKASQYLHGLERDAPAPALITGFARTIKETARRRRLIALGRDIQRIAVEAPASVSSDELRTKADEAVAAIFSDAADMGLRRLPEIGDTVLKRLQRKDEPVGMQLPLASMQNLTGALVPGRVYVLAGSPGSGKSALLLQVMQWAAEEKPGLMFSIEMDDEEQAERAMSTATGIKAERIERALVDDREFERLFNANEETRKSKLYIDGSSSPSMATIRGRALRLKKMVGLGLVGIDHAHYVARPDKRMGENDALDENLKAAKRMAKDLEVPVIVLAQFGTEALRDMAKWPHRRPNQGDLLYSGIFDRHADVVMIVHRREAFLLRNEPTTADRHYQEWQDARVLEEGRGEFILTKRRGGQGFGRAQVGFEGGRVRFYDNPGAVSRAVEPVGSLL